MNLARLKEFYKSYSSLVAPFVILLVGAVVLVPAQLLSSNLRQKVVAESVRMGQNMQALKVWPATQWQEERKLQDAYQKDAERIDSLAKQSTQRQLLSYRIFPEPQSVSQFIFDDFGKAFRNGVDRLIASVNAGDCPTDTELERFKRGSVEKRPFSRSWNEVDAAIEDNLCREKAERATVYIRAVDLDGYEFWQQYRYSQAESRDEAVRNCWYSQLAYWVIEDVVDTVDALNAGSSSVFTSPVKRLLSVTFPLIETRGKTRYRTIRSSKDDKDVLPTYVLSPREGFALAHTRRISNGDIDVVHFQVEVVIGTNAVLSFMKELCSAKQHEFTGWDGSQPQQVFKHNQITILQFDIDAVKRGLGNHALYRYGQDAVVKLSLVCEYIFDTKVYDQVKPKAVKDQVAEALREIERSRQGRIRGRTRKSTKTSTAKPTKSGPKKGVLDDF